MAYAMMTFHEKMEAVLDAFGRDTPLEEVEDIVDTIDAGNPRTGTEWLRMLCEEAGLSLDDD